MSTIKSFAVGNGDMFYINHNSDNFSIVDCYLSDQNKRRIVDEIEAGANAKGIVRYISTHPDEDHLRGLSYLDDRLRLLNFYCTRNKITKPDESDDFRRYCALRDSERAFYLYRNRRRNWMNQSTDERDSAGINIVWPVIDNQHYKDALVTAEAGGSPNNTSVVVKYGLEGGVNVLWMGDLETSFMEKIVDTIEWPKVDIVFAAHHGRISGKIPDKLLDQLNPEFIVIGEAPSRHLHYYGGYDTLTQNSAGDISFECTKGKVHVFVSEPTYSCSSGFLKKESGVSGGGYYIGTLTV